MLPNRNFSPRYVWLARKMYSRNSPIFIFRSFPHFNIELLKRGREKILEFFFSIGTSTTLSWKKLRTKEVKRGNASGFFTAWIDGENKMIISTTLQRNWSSDNAFYAFTVFFFFSRRRIRIRVTKPLHEGRLNILWCRLFTRTTSSKYDNPEQLVRQFAHCDRRGKSFTFFSSTTYFFLCWLMNQLFNISKRICTKWPKKHEEIQWKKGGEDGPTSWRNSP